MAIWSHQRPAMVSSPRIGRSEVSSAGKRRLEASAPLDQMSRLLLRIEWLLRMGVETNSSESVHGHLV